MNRSKLGAEAEISIMLRTRAQANAIAAALGPETLHPAGQKASAKIIRRGQRLNITFKARDSPSLRAVMNSYLRMLRATTAVCGSLLELEPGRGKP